MATQQQFSFDPKKFILAQKHHFDLALKEIKQKRKYSHWIWFIFPQLKGLGRSSISDYYGLEDKESAVSYFNDKTLRRNLLLCVEAILEYEVGEIYQVFGEVDSQKIKSSMTLFYLATKNKIFKNVLTKFYGGNLDKNTIKLLMR